MTNDSLARLAATIAARRNSTSSSSYTKSLLEKGIAACAKKLGEEAAETIIAALSESGERLQSEAADLIYHLLVLLELRNVSLDSVLSELDRRALQSGHVEKSSRGPGGGAS